MRKTLKIGSLTVGASAPVRVESMLKTRLDETDACLAQLDELKKEGCELARVAFPSLSLKDALRRLCAASPLPLMADIHFNPDLALAAMEAGCPSIRVNPGNMGSPERLDGVVASARDRGVVIRVGANSGSVNDAQLRRAGGDRGAALALAVGDQMETLLSRKFFDVIVSAKSTDIAETVRANVLLKRRYGDFPFHVGVTEPGGGLDGVVKSACGLSRLFAAGIGDTMRVSLSQPPADEVRAAYAILRALDLRQRGGRLISCPTCGRRQLDVASVAPRLRELVASLPDGFTVAVMGCEVNGPREARGARLGVAGAPDGLIVFRDGKVVERLGRDADAVAAILRHVPKKT